MSVVRAVIDLDFVVLQRHRTSHEIICDNSFSKESTSSIPMSIDSELEITPKRAIYNVAGGVVRYPSFIPFLAEVVSDEVKRRRRFR